jgi:predicted DNA-binding transcriptional regulator AlpA
MSNNNAAFSDQTEHRLLTPIEAAAWLGMSVSFLAKSRVTGGGPRYRKIGRAVRYSAADLERFARTCARTSTSVDVPAGEALGTLGEKK